MSNTKEKMTKVSSSIPESVDAKVSKRISDLGYKNRAEYFRSLIVGDIKYSREFMLEFSNADFSDLQRDELLEKFSHLSQLCKDTEISRSAWETSSKEVREQLRITINEKHDFKVKLDRKSRSYDKLCSSNADLIHEKNVLEERILHLQKQIEGQRSTLEGLRTSKTNLESKLKSERVELANAKKCIEVAVEESSKLSSALSTLKETSQALYGENESLKSQIRSKDETIEHKQNNIDELNQLIDSERKSSTETIDSLIADLNEKSEYLMGVTYRFAHPTFKFLWKVFRNWIRSDVTSGEVDIEDMM